MSVKIKMLTPLTVTSYCCNSLSYVCTLCIIMVGSPCNSPYMHAASSHYIPCHTVD